MIDTKALRPMVEKCIGYSGYMPKEDSTKVANLLLVCLDEIDRLRSEARRPLPDDVARALPKAMDVPEHDYSGPVLQNEGDIAYAEGWNACLTTIAAAAKGEKT